MAIFFAPEVEYKAPTFQELVAPLAMYKQYYDQQEKEFNAQREKAAALRAMLGTDPNNEISAYMKDYNDLLDQTSQQYASGDMPYAKLYDNVRQLQDIWLDKGLKMTNAIEANTKYREARAKHPNWIGPDLKLQDFLADPQRFYSFFDPEEAAKAGATAGAIYAQQNPHGQAEKDRDGVLRYWVGPTPAQLQDVFTNPQNPFYAEAQHAMSNNGIDPNDAAQVAAFQKQYIQGLASAGKYEYAKDPTYETAAERASRLLTQENTRSLIDARKEKTEEEKREKTIWLRTKLNGGKAIQNIAGDALYLGSSDVPEDVFKSIQGLTTEEVVKELSKHNIEADYHNVGTYSQNPSSKPSTSTAQKSQVVNNPTNTGGNKPQNPERVPD